MTKSIHFDCVADTLDRDDTHTWKLVGYPWFPKKKSLSLVLFVRLSVCLSHEVKIDLCFHFLDYELGTKGELKESTVTVSMRNYLFWTVTLPEVPEILNSMRLELEGIIFMDYAIIRCVQVWVSSRFGNVSAISIQHNLAHGVGALRFQNTIGPSR